MLSVWGEMKAVFEQGVGVNFFLVNDNDVLLEFDNSMCEMYQDSNY